MDSHKWNIQVIKNQELLKFTDPKTKEKINYFETELTLGEALMAARSYILKQREK